MGPNLLVPISLAAFPLAVAALFSTLAPRRAVLVSMLGGWMFLPHFNDRYHLFLVASKAAFVPAVVLAGSLLFDQPRWSRYRASRLDLPVAVLALGPFLTALANGMGAYEAFSAALDGTMVWGAPYLLGRAYLGSPRGARDFARALAVGALVYVPLCLWEIRMSPQLHFMVYGFRPFGFDQVIRFGGYRPAVFMQHGLALGFFMTAGSLCAYWLWRTGERQPFLGVPPAWTTAALVVTTVLCKSTGAILLLAAGVAALEATRRLRTATLVLLLCALPPAYCASRIAGWNARAVVQTIRDQIDPERASGVQFRIDNEDLLVWKAMLRPWLGWGRYGRSFVYDETGELRTTTDSLWVIILGTSGLAGLLALGAMLLLPPVLLARTFPAHRWGHPRVAPAAALAVVLVAWAFDDLLNAMITPLFPAMAGTLVSLVLLARAARARPPQAAARPARPRAAAA